MLLVAVTIAFTAAWASAVLFFLSFLWLAVRSKALDATTHPSLRALHSVYTWPVQLVRPSTWRQQRERKVALMAKVFGTMSVTAFAIVGVLAAAASATLP